MEGVGMITGVQFGFMPSDAIKQMASATIKETILYEKRVPRRGGMHDPRLGPVDRSTLCSTCGLELEHCQGHSGVIPEAGDLAFYCPWVLEHILKVLRCVCFYCSRLLLPADSLRCRGIVANFRGKHRLQELVKACLEIKHCGAAPKEAKVLSKIGLDMPAEKECGCMRDQPVYRKIGIAISAHFTLLPSATTTAPRFNPAVVYHVLKNISDRDARIMGFRPEHSPIHAMMVKQIYVPTTHIRFPVMSNEQSRSRGEDDISLKYNSMLKLRNKLVAALAKDDDGSGKVRSFHATYRWGTTDCKCGNEQWPARPSPTCPCVTKEKSEKAPIAVVAEKKDGKKEKKEKSLVDYWNELQTEYIAMVTGEYRKMTGNAASNKSDRPRSQKASHGIRGIKLRLTGKGGRIRGNLCGKRQDFSARTVISGSLDIDIDEIGVPYHFKSILTKEEIVTKSNIHFLTGLLRNGEIVNIHSADGKEEWNCSYLNHSSVCLKVGQRVDRHLRDGDKVVIGRQPSLHRPSMMVHRVRILPPGIFTFLLNLAVTVPYNADFDGDEMYLIVLQSAAAVIEATLLMHVPSQILSPQGPRALITLVQHSVLAAHLLGQPDTFLSRSQMMQYAGAFPYSGALPPPAIQELYTGKQLFSLFLPPTFDFHQDNVLFRNGQWLTGLLTKGLLQHVIHRLVRDYGGHKTAAFISGIQRVLKLFLDDFGSTLGPNELMNPCRAITDEIMDKIEYWVDHNAASDAEKSRHIDKAKEFATERILQHLAVKGGSRRNGLLDVVRSGAKGTNTNLLQLMACLGETRLLGKAIAFPTAHFTLTSQSAAARGLIRSSFATGLRPYESFYHFASGREGIVDTGAKTGKVGYFQRKMARMLGDLRVESDGTVRDAEGRIVQYRYGDDGFAPSFVEYVPARFLAFKTPADLEREYKHKDLDEEWNKYIMPACRDLHRFINLRGTNETKFTCPVPFHRLFRLLPAASGNVLTPVEIFRRTVQLWNRLQHTHFIFRALFWDWLAVRKLPPLALNQMLALEQLILVRYLPQGLVKCGEMVGILAAQSIAEPAMQMTLRTFYLPGVGSMLLQSGFDMLNDICNATQDSTQKSMTVYLRPEHQNAVHAVEKTLPALVLQHVSRSIKVQDLAGSGVTCPCLATARRLMSFLCSSIRASRYFVEIELKAEYATAGNKKIITAAIEKFMAGDVEVLECGNWLQVHVDRFHVMLDGMDTDNRHGVEMIAKQLAENVLIRGFAKIRDAKVQKDGSIFVLGSQLEAVWALPEVDVNRTLSSDIREIESLFGIDAAALMLEDRLMTCMKSQNIGLDERHAKLVAANMTRSGRMVPNTSMGVATESRSVIRKGTFEKVLDHWKTDAMFGEFDPCRGVVEQLTVSALPRMGTTYSNVVPPPPLPTIKQPGIPRTYAMLRDIPSVKMDMEKGKRFMPSSLAACNTYVPENTWFSPLTAFAPEAAPQGSIVQPFMPHIVPSWIIAS